MSPTVCSRWLRACGLAVLSSWLVTESKAQFTDPGDLNPTLWLVADSANVVTDGSSGVTSWTDLSSSGFNLTDPGATLRPVLVENELSGHDVIRFDGSNDYLLHADVLMSDLFADSEASVFIVQKDNGPSQTLNLSLYNEGSNQGLVANLDYTPPGVLAFQHGSQVISTSVPADWYGNWHVNSLIRDGNSGTIRIGGEPKTISGSFTALANVSFTQNLHVGGYPGGGLTLGGDIAEIIVFDQAITGTDLANIESYLGQKYNLAPVPEPSEYAIVFSILCLAVALVPRLRGRFRQAAGSVRA